MTLLKYMTPKRFRPRPGWNFNLTPLVDIVFQLIVFFMVVSHVVSAESQPLEVPDPDSSQAKQRAAKKYTVINLFAGPAGQIDKIKVNATVLADLPALTDMLLRHSRQFQSQMKLLVRADKQIHYGHVRQVLAAISNAGIGSIELSAQVEQSNGGNTIGNIIDNAVD